MRFFGHGVFFLFDLLPCFQFILPIYYICQYIVFVCRLFRFDRLCLSNVYVNDKGVLNHWTTTTIYILTVYTVLVVRIANWHLSVCSLPHLLTHYLPSLSLNDLWQIYDSIPMWPCTDTNTLPMFGVCIYIYIHLSVCACKSSLLHCYVWLCFLW